MIKELSVIEALSVIGGVTENGNFELISQSLIIENKPCDWHLNTPFGCPRDIIPMPQPILFVE